MSAFSAAFTQLFAMFVTLFSAGEKIAKTFDNLATVAEESSGQYVDEARHLRKQKLIALQAQAPGQIN